MSRISNFTKSSRYHISAMPKKASRMCSESRSFVKSKMSSLKSVMKQQRVRARSYMSSCASKFGFRSSGIGRGTSVADAETTPLLGLDSLSELEVPTDTNEGGPAPSVLDAAGAAQEPGHQATPPMSHRSVPTTHQGWGKRGPEAQAEDHAEARNFNGDMPANSASPNESLPPPSVDESGTKTPVTAPESPSSGVTTAGTALESPRNHELCPTAAETPKSSIASRWKQKWNASSIGSRASTFAKSCKNTYSSVCDRITSTWKSRPVKQMSSIWSSESHLNSLSGTTVSEKASHSSRFASKISGLREKYSAWRTRNSRIIPLAQPLSIYDPSGTYSRPNTVLSS